MSINNVEPARVSGRLGLAWANLLEIMREGRISEPYGTPFDRDDLGASFALRRYRAPGPTRVPPLTGAILLVPPLMVTAEVYDISHETSAVRALLDRGADVWVVDFGAPELAPGGNARTLDDHVRAISRALDHVYAATGQPVHLAGYSQGGMFCYQAAAWRKGAGIASVVAFGSPVDWHRTLPKVAPEITDKLLVGIRTILDAPLSRMTRVPGAVAAAGFKLVSARKELGQLVEFIGNLHDREALARREARRLFLGGGGFISWPGPAMRAFIDELVVGNRLTAGGLVLDGDVVSLRDLTCPVLYFIGQHDEIARPPTVRAIVDAAPADAQIFESAVPAGHFGIVVGRVAQAQTWPQVAAWMSWIGNATPPPPWLHRVARGLPTPSTTGQAASSPPPSTPRWRDVLAQSLDALTGKAADAGAELGRHLENARWQVPRLSALATLRDDTAISLGRALADGAAAHGDQTLFIWAGRAVSYAQANARVDAVAAALALRGVSAGDAIAVWMDSRPSLLMAIVALNRLGAVAAIMPPELTATAAFDAASLTRTEIALVDPEHTATAAQVFTTVIPIKTLGVATIEGPVSQPTPPTDGPAANPGLARELALIFVRQDQDGSLRTTHITNRRWAFSALGAAAACMLTGRDTVYCCLPLHHPSGLLVAASSALVGGARLALAQGYAPLQLLHDARTYGVTVVFYAGEVCRRLVQVPRSGDEHALPIRLFAGSGLDADTWRQMKARFRAGIVEFYGASEASVVLVNASGEKIGSVGRPLPGSAQVAIASYDVEQRAVRRGADGHVLAMAAGAPGLLIAKLEGAWDQLGARAPQAILADVFAFGDHWYATRELATMDADGDVFLRGRVDRPAQPATKLSTNDAA
ncbi:MAG: AMP-binding protein [Myxococcales bacterium]|nr:AMP-binding protein [Myxococcales bacterium]